MHLKGFKSQVFQILICNCFKYCIFEHYIAYLYYLITVFAIYMQSIFSSYACGGFFTQLCVKTLNHDFQSDENSAKEKIFYKW